MIVASDREVDADEGHFGSDSGPVNWAHIMSIPTVL